MMNAILTITSHPVANTVFTRHIARALRQRKTEQALPSSVGMNGGAVDSAESRTKQQGVGIRSCEMESLSVCVVEWSWY